MLNKYLKNVIKLKIIKLKIMHMLLYAGYVPLQHTAAARGQRTRRVVACGGEAVAVSCGALRRESSGDVQQNLA